jgi:cellulose synthase/poly-beta-1,6-N-acetylglucosamine synthase-like glycosyltransferase
MEQSHPLKNKKQLRVIAGMLAYNEESYVGNILLKAKQYVDEVIVVDDGSTDNTAEVARLAGQPLSGTTKMKVTGRPSRAYSPA